jgi:hypothetical protein
VKLCQLHHVALENNFAIAGNETYRIVVMFLVVVLLEKLVTSRRVLDEFSTRAFLLWVKGAMSYEI